MRMKITKLMFILTTGVIILGGCIHVDFVPKFSCKGQILECDSNYPVSNAELLVSREVDSNYSSSSFRKIGCSNHNGNVDLEFFLEWGEKQFMFPKPPKIELLFLITGNGYRSKILSIKSDNITQKNGDYFIDFGRVFLSREK